MMLRFCLICLHTHHTIRCHVSGSIHHPLIISVVAIQLVLLLCLYTKDIITARQINTSKSLIFNLFIAQLRGMDKVMLNHLDMMWKAHIYILLGY